MGSVTFFFDYRNRNLEVFAGIFTPVELEEDDRMTEEELKEMEEKKEETMMEIKANNWFKLIYHLTRGDVTKTESVMRSNANYIFHILGFEKMNSNFVKNYQV